MESPEEQSEEVAEEPLGPVAKLEKLAEPILKSARHSTFFHTIALLERLSKDAVRVGGDGPPRDERIRFRHDYELNFSAGDISSLEVKAFPRGPERSLDEPVPHFQVTTTFLGLTGAMSPLPLYIAEEVLHEDEDNPVRRDFLDIFHHRLISLLYRAVSKYMPAREHLSTRTDDWMSRALFLTGLDPSIQTRDLNVRPATLVRLAPLLAGRGRGPRVLALALQEALGDGLGEDGRVQITQFAGGWIEVDEDQRMSLGNSNNVLGIEAILGKRAFDQSGRFGVKIGPLHRHNYHRFLRDGDLLPVVQEIVELCSKESLDFDVELELAADAVPSFTLTEDPMGACLGRDTRLRGGERAPEVMRIPDVGNMAFGKADEPEAPADAAE
ncbi:MAG: type VI secretion system baseplate subunit TssG [Sandaracinaceae bacterium]